MKSCLLSLYLLFAWSAGGLFAVSFEEAISVSRELENPLRVFYPDQHVAIELNALPVEDNSTFGRSPWNKLPYVAAGTALLYANDIEIQRWAQERRTPETDRIANFARQIGEPETYKWAYAGLYLYGQWSGDRRAKNLVRHSAESLIIGGLATQILKYAIRRPRPGDVFAEDPFEIDGGRISFPSGHSTVAWAFATVLVNQYGDQSDLIAPLAYTLASLAAWSRANDNVHWPSDVLFGSFIGYAAAKTVIPTNENNGKMQILPVNFKFAL